VRRKRSAAKQTSKNTIRARKNTELKTVGNELQLRFTGDDPGIAMDLRNRKIAAGPYQLTFRLIGGSQGGGELFYTTKPSTTLPKGERTTFDVLANGQWQDVLIELPTDESLRQLRLDVSDGAGKATITDLKLLDASGAVLVAWPGK
jgi:hypothetical protein